MKDQTTKESNAEVLYAQLKNDVMVKETGVQVSDTTKLNGYSKAGQQKNPASKTKQDFLKCQRGIFLKSKCHMHHAACSCNRLTFGKILCKRQLHISANVYFVIT